MLVTEEERAAILAARRDSQPLQPASESKPARMSGSLPSLGPVADSKGHGLHEPITHGDTERGPFFAGHRFKFLESLTPEGSAEKWHLEIKNKGEDYGPIMETFRLRSSWDPVKLFEFDSNTRKWVESEASGTASDGAEFGWNRNNITAADSWSANGVAYFPMLFQSTLARQYLFVPSVEFNRDTSTDGTANEINSLIGRLGLEFNWVNDREIPGLEKGYVIRTALGYQTDFDFASGQWILDFQAEKVDEEQGIGVFSPREDAADPARREAAASTARRQILGIEEMPRKITIAPILSFASIEDIAGKESLEQLEDMTYATIGAKIGLDYELAFLRHTRFLAGFSSTKIGAEYRVWTTIGSSSQSFDYIDAHLIMPFLGTSDKLTLKAFYRYGDTPDTLERVDMLGLALTAKF